MFKSFKIIQNKTFYTSNFLCCRLYFDPDQCLKLTCIQMQSSSFLFGEQSQVYFQQETALSGKPKKMVLNTLSFYKYSRDSCHWRCYLIDLQFSVHGLCTSAGVTISLPLLRWEFPGTPFFHGGKILPPGQTLTTGFQILLVLELSCFFCVL